jgi:hypothetical protein
MYTDFIVLVLMTAAVPVIALVAFLSVAKTKRRRRPV